MHTERYEAGIAVSEYLEKYVEVDRFLEGCARNCPNYGTMWACPPYDFDVAAYWRQFEMLRVIAVKIVLDEGERQTVYEPEAINARIMEILSEEKAKIGAELEQLEAQTPGSRALMAGSCTRCPQGCARKDGEACRFPEKLRYSMESLGGNVVQTLADLMGIQMKWAENGRLPEYFVLVGGLLMKE